MAQKKFNSLFLYMIWVLLLVAGQSPSVAARKFVGVNPFCLTATHKRLCTMMVNGATNWHDASMNAMKSALELSKFIQSNSHLIPPAISFLEPQSRESILASCAEDFEITVADIEESITALEANDIGTVRVHLSAAYSSDCADALAEFGADYPLSKLSGHLSKLVDNCLAVVQQI